MPDLELCPIEFAEARAFIIGITAMTRRRFCVTWLLVVRVALGECMYRFGGWFFG